MFNRTVEQNKKLIKKHPYLKPRNVLTGKEFKDYDYTWTNLDEMPGGWNKAFGEQFVEELTAAFDKDDKKFKKNYFVTQIKEKYGGLRWYDAGITEAGYEVVKKYEKLSEITCIICGNPATKISSGWICPYCDEHIGDHKFNFIIENGEISVLNKYFVVSDIHGHFTILRETLENNGFNVDNPKHILIVAGDILDRGQEAIKTVLFLASLPKERLIFVRGNHEDLMEQLLLNLYKLEPIQLAHIKNKTLDSIVQLTGISGIDLVSADYTVSFIKDKMKIFTDLLKDAVDYFEIGNYIIVHGWIPSGRNWRKASKEDWKVARWYNGILYAHDGRIEEGKTIICGHWHTSFGNYNYHDVGSGEFTEDADFGIYQDKGIIALDACTSFTNKMNIYTFEI